MKINLKYTTSEGEPIKCPRCKCKNIKPVVRNTIEYTVLEEEYYCSDCYYTVGYWAYGAFDPDFIVYKLNLREQIREIFRKLDRAITSFFGVRRVEKDWRYNSKPQEDFTDIFGDL